MLHQEADVACLELHSLVAENLRVRPHVDVEGARAVGGAARVPLESAHADLEGIHATAIVLQLLVAIFSLIKAVCFVLKPDGEATELGVDGDEVCSKHRLNHELESLGEVVHQYFHLSLSLFLVFLLDKCCAFCLVTLVLCGFTAFDS